MSEAESKEKEMAQNGGMTEVIEDLKDMPPASSLKNTDDAVEEISKSIDESDDKLDEFSRLELEMAELDKTDDGACANTVPLNDIIPLNAVKENIAYKDVETDKTVAVQCDKKHDDNAPLVHQNGQAATNTAASEPAAKVTEKLELFDHEDLIAVLKGDTDVNPIPTDIEKPKNLELSKDELPSSTATISDLLIEGVTIEGEGEYQIMEVVDDIEDEADNNLPSTSKVLNANLEASAKNSTSQKLTPEEERAMAMEQIAGLNARGPRRRKQDIRPLHIETSELVSTLGADWTDDDDDMRADDERPTSSKNAVTTRKELPLTAQPTNQEVTSTEIDTKSSVSPGAVPKRRRRSVAAKISPSEMPKAEVAETSNDVNSNTADTATPVPVIPESIGATGFKRKRVIRRPLIYDPDVPETAYSYAQLVNSSARENRESLSASVASKAKSVTPKEVISGEKKGRKRAATPSQSAASAKKNANESVANAKSDNQELPSTSKQMQRPQSTSPDVGISSNSGPGSVGKKKKISELDRLMGDEGAANMLNSLESGRGKATEDSENKPHKPLMRNRVGASEKISKKDVSSNITSSTATPKTKRALKPKPSTSWDYVYQKQNNEDSMIIRRRSNSSYSSNASLHRLSLDGTGGLASKSSNAKSPEQSSDEGSETSSAVPMSTTPRKIAAKAIEKSDEESVNSVPNKLSNASGNKNFEFAKPKEAKQNQKAPNRRSKSNTANPTSTLANDIKKGAGKRGRPTNAERQVNAEQTNAQNTGTKSPSPTYPPPSTASPNEEIIVRKIGKIAHIIFNMSSAQINCTFTSQIMNKIVAVLKSLSDDANCHVVVVTTSSPNFCQGIDYANLANGSVDQRKTASIVLATATKNFLRSLAEFPKPLIAGIHGTIIGLGVTQLPLFDVVISAESVTFETPYAKIGQIPEGFCIWQSLPKIHETIKTKLFWLAEKVNGSDAASMQLVDKIVPLDRLHDEALNTAKRMAEMSPKTYRHMKNFVIEKRSEAISRALDKEFEEITAQWISPECFNKFKKSLENGGHF